MGEAKANGGVFGDLVAKLWERMNPCVLCPRQCKANRSKGERGYCGISERPLVSSVGSHYGEESCLVGKGGSGTIFFAGCNLSCAFCQNYDISQHRSGREMTIEQMAEAMLELEASGASNINLVTPSHVIAPIAAAIELAKKDGLRLPIVYNSGGYDSVQTLKLLEGFIDIYMPDAKYSDSATAEELSGAADYPEVNRAALKEMHRQVGDLSVEGGLAVRGLLVRHLVLPEGLAGSFATIDFLAEQVSGRTAINVMDQYRPCYRAFSQAKINRRPAPEEIESVIAYATTKGLRVIS
ncbi:MAG: radical SAM protein [Planctomycetota bacterium]